MRYALYRLTAPILDRIPDISRQPKGRQMSIGLIASLLFHFLLLLVAVVFGMVLPEHGLLHFAKPKPQLEEIEITIIPVAQNEEVRLMTPEEIANPKPFIDSRGLATADQAPDKPVFESDSNMKAASELPATGNLPMPTQAGRTEPEFPNFTDQKMALGKTAAPPEPSAPPAPPTPQTPPAEPTVLAKTEPAPAAEVPPGLEKAPPTPMKETLQPNEDEIAMTTKAAAPPEAQPAPSKPLFRTRATMPVAMLATPAPKPRSKSGFQPEQQKTRIEGNISNRGKNAVDAVGTPMGRYRKAVNDAVGSRWYYYTAQKTSLIAPGSVRVTFAIDEKGRAVDVRSEGNTSNSSFATMCEQAIREAEIAPPPADLMEPLLEGKLDFSITFSFHTF